MPIRKVRDAVLAVLFRPAITDMYTYQEVAANGDDVGPCETLSYIDARTRLQLRAPSLTRAKLDHVFALVHDAQGGPVEAHDIDERKGALRYTARLCRVVP